MNITDISGIGDSTAQQLKTHGIDSVEDVAQASIAQLAAVPGIGANRAAALKRSAIQLLPDTSGAEETEAVTGAEEAGAKGAPAGVEAKRVEDREGKKGTKDRKRDKVKERKKEEKRQKRKKKEKKKGKESKKGKNKRK